MKLSDHVSRQVCRSPRPSASLGLRRTRPLGRPPRLAERRTRRSQQSRRARQARPRRPPSLRLRQPRRHCNGRQLKLPGRMCLSPVPRPPVVPPPGRYPAGRLRRGPVGSRDRTEKVLRPERPCHEPMAMSAWVPRAGTLELLRCEGREAPRA